MNFNKHSGLEGQHAFLSASKYHWVNYDESKIIESFANYMAAQKGTRLHDFARQAIELGVKLQANNKSLNKYVNDAIGFKMQPEQLLYFSDNCFGTADAISFRNNFLRIHDFKSGVTPASVKQLEVYTALFCLEYRIDPSDIDIELRIYQNNEISAYIPRPEDIQFIMNKIIEFDKKINELKMET